MPVPFGIGVGDFVAISALIKQVAVELSENGEAAPDYQSLIVELETLDRALKQLLLLKPTQHELASLNAIRMTALTCRQPLQEFMSKISKFDSKLGMSAASEHKYTGTRGCQNSWLSENIKK